MSGGGAARVLLLRGVNLGPNRRVSMPDLRAALEAAGYGPVKTYLQSGNVALRSDAAPEELERAAVALIAEHFELNVPVISRTAEEIGEIVARNPLGAVARDPKRYQVSFCATEPPADALARLEAAEAGEERVVAHGREIYAWHPDGVARSKLWSALAGTGLGTPATARNWATVTALRDLAETL